MKRGATVRKHKTLKVQAQELHYIRNIFKHVYKRTSYKYCI